MGVHASNYISGGRLRRMRLIRKSGVYALAFMLAAFSLVYVWQRLQVVTMGYEIETLKKQKDEAVKENKALKIEAATLTSPDRIDAIARNDISMKTPADSQIVMVKRVARGKGKGPDSSRQARRPDPAHGES